jgi:hypothetical protein
MSFKLCPYSLEVRGLFAQARHRLLQPRQTLRQRADDLKHHRRITDHRARQFIGRERFQLNHNRFQVNLSSPMEIDQLLTPLISYFGSITRGRNIDIKVAGPETQDLNCLIEIYDRTKLRHALVEFDLFPDQDRLIINFISGSSTGLAGRSLVALYNVAREIKIGLIGYYIVPENLASKQFFYHMDFGRPKNEDWSWWEQKVD